MELYEFSDLINFQDDHILSEGRYGGKDCYILMRNVSFDEEKDRLNNEIGIVSRIADRVPTFPIMAEGRGHWVINEKNMNKMTFMDRKDKSGTVLSNIISCMTKDDKISILYTVYDMMRKMHALGIVHGNINPDNIFVDNDMKPYIINFGESFTLDGLYPASPNRIKAAETDDYLLTEASDYCDMICLIIAMMTKIEYSSAGYFIIRGVVCACNMVMNIEHLHYIMVKFGIKNSVHK